MYAPEEGREEEEGVLKIFLVRLYNVCLCVKGRQLRHVFKARGESLFAAAGAIERAGHGM